MTLDAAAGSQPVTTRPTTVRDRVSGAYAALSRHEHAAAAALIALVVVAHLHPALLGGQLLSPVSMLYVWVPWVHAPPSDLLDHVNTLLSDVPTGHYPWDAMAREAVRSGEFPAWNRQAFGGVPFFANPQVGFFSLFSLPIWLLPLHYGIALSAALKLWAAGFGTYLLSRELRLGFAAGLLAAIGYAFCSFNIVWLTHQSLPAVAAGLPWMLLLTERIVRERRAVAVLLLAVATALTLGGGHPGTQIHVLLATALFGLVRGSGVRGLTAPDRVKRLALVAGGLVLGVLLMAAMFVPELFSTRGTLGTEARRAGEAVSPGSDMSVRALLTTVFPDYWGRPSGDFVEQPALGNYNEYAFYAGAVVLLLALAGLATRGNWRRKLPFAVLGALGLAIPLRMPGLQQLIEATPFLSVVQNQRFHFVFELAAATLAGFGLDALVERRRDLRWEFAVPLGGLALALVAIGLVGPSELPVTDAVGRVLHDPTAQDLARRSIAWFALFAVAVLLAFAALRRWPDRWPAIVAALVLVAVFDMLHFAHGYQPMGPADRMIPPRTPAIAYLQRHASDSRILGLGYALPNAWSATYGLDDVRGYDPPYPTMRLYRLWQAANPHQLNWAPFIIETLWPTSAQVTSLLGGRWVIAPPGIELDRSSRQLRALRQVYDGDDATILENAEAVPRVRVAPKLVLSDGADETRALLIADTFDPRDAVVVERDEEGAAALAGLPPAHGTVRVTDESNATVTLSAELDRRGLVVFNDSLLDGWSVTVDGEPQPAILVNSFARGVAVGPGRHEIEWSYRVPGLAAGIAISAVAWLGLVAALVSLTLLRRHRRSRPR